jgi:hypothetical protein
MGRGVAQEAVVRGAVDDLVGQDGQAHLVAAGVATQDRERLVDGDAASLSEHALGLFDDEPTVERPLQLLGECLGLPSATFAQERDRRDPRQGLGEPGVGVVVVTDRLVVELERSEHLGVVAERPRVHRPEPEASGLGSEGDPVGRRGVQIGAGHRASGARGVVARPFVAQRLEECGYALPRGRRRHRVEVAMLVGEPNDRGGGAQQLHAGVGEPT